VSVLHSCPHCGCELTKSRSGADHRRYFGLIRAAFLNWPESHPQQFANEDALRAWLLIEVGHYDVEFIAYPEECEENPSIKALFRLAIEATYAAVTRKRGYATLRVSAGGVEILTPKSIDFRSVSQKEFGPIREACEAILENELGVTAEQLLRERAA
jgi:hypothetical protein